MMFPSLKRLLVILCVFCAGRVHAGDALSLFDGDSLLGWYTDTPAAASVEEGSIVLGPGPVHFSYVRSFTNFIFEAECRVEEGKDHDAGLAFRVSDLEGGNGFEVTSRGLITRLGHSATSNSISSHEVFKPGEWNTLRVICSDSLIQVYINGNRTDHLDVGSVSGGFPALLSRGVSQQARFRSIRLRVLDSAPPEQVEPFDPAPHSHIAIIGGGLAADLVEAGYFESLLHQRYPDHHLVVRGLASYGDSVSVQQRPRFTESLEHQLQQMEADIILVLFGGNESFDEEERRLFGANLQRFIHHMRRRVFNGRSPPQLVMISPSAVADVTGFPSADKRNRDLDLVSGTMRRVALKERVAFADIFTPTLRLQNQSADLTWDGVRYNEAGARELALLLDRALFRHTNHPAPAVEHADHLISLVRLKNRLYAQRQRPLNSFYISGPGREPFGVNHFPDEMRQLNERLIAADFQVWAAATGQEKPAMKGFSPLPHTPAGKKDVAELLSPDDQLKAFTVHPEYRIELFASEKQFPELANPSCIRIDDSGRIWVLVSPDYPMPLPGEIDQGKLLVLSDTDQDGSADKMTVFADGLRLPIGFALAEEGVYLAQPPHLLLLQDTDGDGRADLRRPLVSGFGTEDAHQSLHSFTWGPDGSLYFQESHSLQSRVETPWGVLASRGTTVFRFFPKQLKLSIYTSIDRTDNPWGHVFDRWGRSVNSMSPHLAPSTVRLPPMQAAPSRPGAGAFSSLVFLDADTLAVSSYKEFHGVKRYRWKNQAADYVLEPMPDLLASDARSFIPVDMALDYDGALYLADWANPVLGLFQYSFRDPRRDHSHGRIWRVAPKASGRVNPDTPSSDSVPALLTRLKHPDETPRTMARQILHAKSFKAIEPHVDDWIKGLDPGDPGADYHLLEMLWLYQAHHHPRQDLLERLLRTQDHRIRAAATRVLADWYDNLPDGLALLQRAARDDHPLVRLEAVVTASWQSSADAARAALEVCRMPMPQPMTYSLKLCMRTLEPAWMPELKQSSFAVDNPDGLEFLLRHHLSGADKELALEPLLPQRLMAEDLSLDERAARLKKLSSLGQVDASVLLYRVLTREDYSAAPQTHEHVQRLLLREPLDQLRAMQDSLREASKGQQSLSRLSLAMELRCAADKNEFWKERLNIENETERTEKMIKALEAASLLSSSHMADYGSILFELASTKPDGFRKPLIRFLRQIEGSEMARAELCLSEPDDMPLSDFAVTELLSLPAHALDVKQAEVTVSRLITAMSSMSVEHRVSQEYLDRAELVRRYLPRLEVRQQRDCQEKLAAWHVPVLTLSILAENAQLDQDDLVASAERTVVLSVMNQDSQNHALMVLVPGSRKKVLKQMSSVSGEDDMARLFAVRKFKQVLDSSNLLKPGQSTRLFVAVPGKKGDYLLFCPLCDEDHQWKGRMVIE
jgi:lysophospholipase L1-like esterase